MPVADPMALLAAFASGELEALWPQRKVLIEKGWFIWQARIRETAATWDAQIAEQGGGRAQELWAEGASADVPDYLT